MIFYKNLISKLLENILLSVVIKKFLVIEKRGNNFFSLCPFHNEKTPSFIINDIKKIYYCFGCKKTGNAINFIMEYKKLTFKEAINYIQNIQNISNDNVKNIANEFFDNNLYYSFLDTVLKIYKNNYEYEIKNNLTLQKFVIDRNLEKKVCDVFNIGYSSNYIRPILKMLDKKDIDIALKLGVLNLKNKNLYDKFAYRIIFPIKNVNGNIIGFGGRVLNNKIKPKYINSSESNIFRKKNELFGLYEALKNKNYNNVIVVEGYLDVISMYKIGIENTVSPLGTSFSVEQFNLLKKYFKNIIFCFDGDEAGQIALYNLSKKLIKFLNENIYISFVILPLNHDPDDMIKIGKKDLLLNLINSSMYILDFIFYFLSKNIKEYTIKNQINIFCTVKTLLNDIQDISLKEIILNYFKKKIFNNTEIKKIVYNDKSNKVLSLSMKACIFLLKKKDLFKLITHFKFDKDQKDIEIFLDLLDYLKYNKKKDVLSKIDLNNGFILLINEMDDVVIKTEFLSIVEKIKEK